MTKRSSEDFIVKQILKAARFKSVELDLTNLGITTLPDEIKRASSLKVLRLGNDYHENSVELYSNNQMPVPNHIEVLSSGVFDLVNLEHLDLAGVGLCSISQEIGHLKKLKSLNLGIAVRSWYQYGSGDLREEKLSNSLSSLPSNISNLTFLEALDLSGNQLTSLPPQIGNLSRLKYLNIKGNEIISLPMEISNLSCLEQFIC